MQPVVITLKPGQSLRIELADTDGAFEIHYDTPTHKNQLVVKEAEGLPDSYCRTGMLYCEEFGKHLPGLTEAPAEINLMETDEEAGEAEELYTASPAIVTPVGLTWAIYSATRKQWFKSGSVDVEWIAKRCAQCEFTEPYQAHEQCRVLYHKYGYSEQLEVLRSDQRHW